MNSKRKKGKERMNKIETNILNNNIMKKSLLFAAIASVALVGCTKDENFYEKQQQEIGFMPVAYKAQTRAVITDGTYPTNHTFGAFAWHGTSGAIKTKSFMDNVEIHYSGGVWKPNGKTYYWPKSDKLDFFCYSPFNSAYTPTLVTDATAASNSVQFGNNLAPITVTPGSTDDIMYSTKVIDQNFASASGTVSVVFNHALALVGFTAQASTLGDGSTVTPYLKSITVKDIETKGELKMILNEGKQTWNLPTNQIWTVKANNKIDYSKTCTDNNSKGQELTASSVAFTAMPAFIVMPQSTDGITVEIAYYVKTVTGSVTEWSEEIKKTVDLKTKGGLPHWQMNRKINYNITIDPTDNLKPILFDPSVTLWQDESGEENLDIPTDANS